MRDATGAQEADVNEPLAAVPSPEAIFSVVVCGEKWSARYERCYSQAENYVHITLAVTQPLFADSFGSPVAKAEGCKGAFSHWHLQGQSQQCTSSDKLCVYATWLEACCSTEHLRQCSAKNRRGRRWWLQRASSSQQPVAAWHPLVSSLLRGSGLGPVRGFWVLQRVGSPHRGLPPGVESLRGFGHPTVPFSLPWRQPVPCRPRPFEHCEATAFQASTKLKKSSCLHSERKLPGPEQSFASSTL